MTKLLFVYGTLRPGQSPEGNRLAVRSRNLGPAYVHGTLVDVQGHQGLVSAKAGARVQGDLLLIDDESVWAEIDAYEGVGEPGWYARGLVVAIDQHGQPRSAWAYVAPGA